MKLYLNNPNSNWHRWFAWRPVLAWDDKKQQHALVVGSFVERRWDATPEDIIECHCWEYRLV